MVGAVFLRECEARTQSQTEVSESKDSPDLSNSHGWNKESKKEKRKEKKWTCFWAETVQVKDFVARRDKVTSLYPCNTFGDKNSIWSSTPPFYTFYKIMLIFFQDLTTNQTLPILSTLKKQKLALTFRRTLEQNQWKNRWNRLGLGSPLLGSKSTFGNFGEI